MSRYSSTSIGSKCPGESESMSIGSEAMSSETMLVSEGGFPGNGAAGSLSVGLSPLPDGGVLVVASGNDAGR